MYVCMYVCVRMCVCVYTGLQQTLQRMKALTSDDSVVDRALVVRLLVQYFQKKHQVCVCLYIYMCVWMCVLCMYVRVRIYNTHYDVCV